MNWYILFVKTGREYKVEREIKRHFDKESLYPFIPLVETFFKRSGRICKKEIKIMFPSYVFVESELDEESFIISARKYIRRNDDIIRILDYGNPNKIAVRDEEKYLLLSLCNTENTIESSIGFIEGDKVYITAGPLQGRESIIKKINRHRMEALLELDLFGRMCRFVVGLNVVNKI